MLKKYGDLWAGAFLTALSVLFTIFSVQIIQAEGSLMGAGFLPVIVFGCLDVLSIMLLVRGIRTSKVTEVEVPEYVHNYLGVALSFIALILYAVLLKTVGFVIMTALFLCFEIYLVSKTEERKPINFVIAIVAAILIYLVFAKGFGIRLPNGLLKGIF